MNVGMLDFPRGSSYYLSFLDSFLCIYVFADVLERLLLPYLPNL